MSRSGESSAKAVRIPATPPTTFRTTGSSRKENSSVRNPCTKSVIIAARRPPARPYTTNNTVITMIAVSAEIAEFVQASTTAPEPFSMLPIVTTNFASPNTQNRIATDGAKRAANTSAVVSARNRRIIGAISQKNGVANSHIH